MLAIYQVEDLRAENCASLEKLVAIEHIFDIFGTGLDKDLKIYWIE